MSYIIWNIVKNYFPNHALGLTTILFRSGVGLRNSLIECQIHIASGFAPKKTTEQAELDRVHIQKGGYINKILFKDLCSTEIGHQ
jgi:hypothetical protein